MLSEWTNNKLLCTFNKKLISLEVTSTTANCKTKGLSRDIFPRNTDMVSVTKS